MLKKQVQQALHRMHAAELLQQKQKQQQTLLLLLQQTW